MTDDALRYLRQVVLKAMDRVRGRMRGSERLMLSGIQAESLSRKELDNPTKGIDREAEDIIIAALLRKLPKMTGGDRLAIFSEERGLVLHPEGIALNEARWIAFIDPVDGTEFAENLQGGWCLVALFDRERNCVEAAVAGDVFLNRLYWACSSGPAEGLDFVTHSWFKLDGGPSPKTTLANARINFLTSKVGRFRAVAAQHRLLDAIDQGGGRINLSWGSNMIIQVAAGYADAAVEFDKGFAAYDILPGLFIGERAGLTILDLDGNRLSSTLDVDAVINSWQRDPKKPLRVKFVAAKEEALARAILDLLT